MPEPVANQKAAAGDGWRELFGFRQDSIGTGTDAGLRFLASGIAGQPVEIETLAQPEPSYSDGWRIFLDPGLTPAQRPLAAVAQAALLGAGSLDRQWLRGISLRPGVAARYFAMELPRALQASEPILPGGFLRELPVPANRSGSAGESLEAAADHRVRVDPAAPWLGVLRPRRILNQDRAGAGGRSSRALKSFRISPIDEHDEDEELDASGASVLKAFSTPLGAPGWLADLFQQILGLGRGSGADDEDDDAGGAHAGGSVAQGGMGETGVSDNILADSMIGERLPLLPVKSDWKYPEWHERSGRYLPDWVSVHEVEAPVEKSSALESCDVSMHSLAQQLFQVGVEFEYHRRQPVGDDIDIDALIDHLVDRATGHSHEEHIYCNSQRTRRDLCTALLVDVSRSTGDRMRDGRTIFGQQVRTAQLISKAFSHFGDRVAVYAFHSWGRAITRLLRVKGFDENEGAVVEKRFAALQASGLTRLGAAIRHASYRLLSEKYHSHRLLMVLTDGLAYDDEYEGRHAEADVEKALAEAREQGIACVCISIGTDRDDESLARTFGSATYLRCPRVADLPGRLRRLVQKALRATEFSVRTARPAQ